MIRELLHLLRRDHSKCGPRTCRIAAAECNRLDSLWREVEYTYDRGPCMDFGDGCVRCERYLLATDIMLTKKSLDSWGK